VGTDWRIAISDLEDFELYSETKVGMGVRSIVFTSDGNFVAGAPAASNEQNQ
jgi:hypothetical protein